MAKAKTIRRPAEPPVEVVPDPVVVFTPEPEPELEPVVYLDPVAALLNLLPEVVASLQAEVANIDAQMDALLAQQIKVSARLAACSQLMTGQVAATASEA